jgi:putative DNA primase/helicase
MNTQADTHPPRPKTLRVILENIPVELRALDQWVTWRYQTARDGKWTKVPYTEEHLPASSTNPTTWTSIHRAMDAYERGQCDGIGFVLHPENGFVGIDLDHCFNLNERKGEPWAIEVIQKLKSYSEFSPSGEGVHIFVKGNLPHGLAGKKKGNVEIYSAGRYLTVTGHRLKNAPVTIEPRQAEIDWLFQKFFTEQEPARPKPNGNGASNATDDELLEKAFAARNGDKLKGLFDGDIAGYPSQSEADLALCSLLAFWAADETQLDRLFRRSALKRDKWDEKHGAATYGEATIAKAWASTTEHYEYRINGGTTGEHPTSNEEPRADTQIPFPESAWIGLFRLWRDELGECTDAPIENLWGAFLLATGMAIGRNRWICNPMPLYPNVYLLLLGDSGISRKSTVLGFAERLLKESGTDFKTLYGIVSTEGIIEPLAAEEGKKALAYADEFRTLLGVANRKGTQDLLPKLNSLYYCRTTSVDRRKDPVTAVDPFFSMMTATPKDYIEDLIGDREVSGGFFNRFLSICGTPRDSKPRPRKLSSIPWEKFRQPLTGLCDLSPREIDFAADATELWDSFFDQWTVDHRKGSPREQLLTERIPEHALKIALIYSTLRERQHIDVESLAVSIKICGWLQSNTLSIFQDIGLDKRSKAEQAIIRRLGKAKDHLMPIRSLQQYCGSIRITTTDFRDALKVLKDTDQIVDCLVTTIGRERKAVKLSS